MPTAPDQIPDNIDFAAQELLEAPGAYRLETAPRPHQALAEGVDHRVGVDEHITVLHRPLPERGAKAGGDASRMQPPGVGPTDHRLGEPPPGLAPRTNCAPP